MLTATATSGRNMSNLATIKVYYNTKVPKFKSLEMGMYWLVFWFWYPSSDTQSAPMSTLVSLAIFIHSLHEKSFQNVTCLMEEQGCEKVWKPQIYCITCQKLGKTCPSLGNIFAVQLTFAKSKDIQFTKQRNQQTLTFKMVKIGHFSLLKSLNNHNVINFSVISFDIYSLLTRN